MPTFDKDLYYMYILNLTGTQTERKLHLKLHKWCSIQLSNLQFEQISAMKSCPLYFILNSEGSVRPFSHPRQRSSGCYRISVSGLLLLFIYTFLIHEGQAVTIFFHHEGDIEIIFALSLLSICLVKIKGSW